MLKCGWCGDKFELGDWEKATNAKHPDQSIEALCPICWLVSRLQEHIARTIGASEIFTNRIINMLVAKGRLESYTTPGEQPNETMLIDLHAPYNIARPVFVSGDDGDEMRLVDEQWEEAVTFVNDLVGY